MARQSNETDPGGRFASSSSLLPENTSARVGEILQLTVVELIALSLAGKQLHWNAYGRGFLSVHRQLDDAVADWRELEDAVAERTAALGICPDGSPSAVIELADLPQLELGFVEVSAALEQICESVRTVAVRVRERTELLGELDLVSQDVLVRVGGKLEQQIWIMCSGFPD